MPEGAADIEVVFRSMLEQECNREIGDEADQRDEHHPSAGNRDRGHEAFEADECDADGGQQQDERVQKCGHDAGAVIAKGPAVRRRSGRQNVRIQRQKERPLIDEIVSRVADQADAVRQKAADKLSDDDDRVAGERNPQPGAEFMVGVRDHSFQCLTAILQGQVSRQPVSTHFRNVRFLPK